MFEEFITYATLEQKERARNWQTAIGLQDVDGLKVSPYLVELAKKHIEGTISIDEVEEKIEKYHNKKLKKQVDNNEMMLVIMAHEVTKEV